ncbi:hypothetical protein AAG906_013872 [Vitis piasezkii]
MDMRSQHTKVLDPIVIRKRASGRCPDAPSDDGIIGLLLGIRRLPGDPLPLRVKAYIYSFRGTVPLINGEEIFYVVMMIIGVTGCGPWLFVVIACKTRFTLIQPFFFRASFGTCIFAIVVPFVAFVGSLNLVFWFVRAFVLGKSLAAVILVCLCGKKWLQKRLFHLPGLARFVPFSTEKAEGHAIIFTKEHFNAGLRFPLPALFKEFLHFSQIPPAFIHPNVVRVENRHLQDVVHRLPSSGDGAARFDKGRGEGTRGGPGWMGGACLELRGHLVDWVEKASFACVSKLLEIDAKERHYKTLLSARNLMAVVRESQDYVIHILPRKLPKEVVPGEHYTVKELSIYQEAKEADAEKRRALLEDREKRKNEGTIRKAPGQKRGADSPPKKKNGKDVKEPTPPKEFPPPPITHEADVIIEEPVNAAPHSISSGPGHVAGLHHSSTSLAAVARLANVAEEAASINHPGNLNPDVDAAEAVCATPTEEAGAESQSHPDDPDRLALVRSGLLGRLQDRQQEIEVSCASAHDAHPEGGEVEMATEVPAAPVIILDADTPGKTHPSNVEAPHPEQKSPSVASSGGESVNDATCSSASSFSYAELEDKLKQIPPGSPDIMPSATMFETVETLVSGLRGMAQQHDLFADLLRTTDYMKLFASRHKESENQLRLRLEEAEAGLSTAREDIEALRAELAEAKSREESTASRLCESENEVARFRGEARYLRTEVSIEKKQREELQLRLVAQKEELERSFFAERRNLQ